MVHFRRPPQVPQNHIRTFFAFITKTNLHVNDMNTAVTTMLLATVWTQLAVGAIWYQPHTTTTTTEVPNSPRVVATNNGNYSISFVPLITLLAGVIPRIINRIRQPSQQITDAREFDVTTPSIPEDFNGANPCIDSILVRRPYPGNACFFYQCELYEPSGPICRLQVLQDPDSPRDIDYKTVDKKSSLLRYFKAYEYHFNRYTNVKRKFDFRISSCLAIRLYRCAAGHVYEKTEKRCIRSIGAYSGEDICLSR